MSQLGIALISLLNTKWAKKELVDGRSSVEWVKEKLNELPEATVCHFISDDESDLSYYQTLFPNNKSVKNEIFPFLDECVRVFHGCDNLLFLYTDAPLNDPQVAKELITLHENEMAEYSFTENYPKGIGAEILSYHTLEKLRNIASGNNESFTRGSISKIIHFDINQYDVEVLVSEIDTRKERLTLLCDTHRNYLIAKNFLDHCLEKQITPTLSEIYTLIKSHPEFMRSTPAYVELEITNDCNCRCIICPRTELMKRPVQHMPLEKVHSVIKELKAFCDELTIALTLMGEPTLHPQLMDIIEFTLSIPGITLILETNGINLDKTMIDRLVKLNSDRLIVIIALDSPDQELYKNIRSVDQLKVVENHVAYLLEKRPTNTYIQILRLKENDSLLDAYYTRWDTYKDQIILQKYNSYKNQLEDRKGADLSPLKRFSCWHLKRDMVILSDGTVPFCKQDINGEHSVGNLFEEGVETIWKKLEHAFIKDHKEQIDPFCENCDEWFTYNF